MPGTKRFICAPNKNQGAQIAKEKIAEIYDKFPLLRREVQGWEHDNMPGNFGKDYVTLKFNNGSQFDVVGALDSQRGGRRHGLGQIYVAIILLYSILVISDLYSTKLVQ